MLDQYGVRSAESTLDGQITDLGTLSDNEINDPENYQDDFLEQLLGLPNITMDEAVVLLENETVHPDASRNVVRKITKIILFNRFYMCRNMLVRILKLPVLLWALFFGK